nr:right-handed parallel beta-helix repeat-containing protein [uncultured Agathobaculum sp.]
MEFDEKVQKVQKVFTAERIKRFAIASPELLKQSDYVKSLYMRMLCALMRCGSPTEEQILFVQRLTAGAQLKDSFTELMRQSMNMDAESITAFLEALSPNDMKYYFVLDGCITCVLGTGNDRFAMLAECAELLGVTEIELRYLVKAAKAIVLQSSEAFDEAKKYQTARTENLSLLYYLKAFYSGVITNTAERFHLYSADKKQFDLSKYELNAQDIVVENVKLDFTKDAPWIENCHSITFSDCDLNGGDSRRPYFKNVESVMIKNCVVQNFSNMFLQVEKVKHISICGNKFRNCLKETLFWDCGTEFLWDKDSYMTDSVIIRDNTIQNCSAHMGVFWLHQCNTLTIVNNHFIGCDFRGDYDDKKSGMNVAVYMFNSAKKPREMKISGNTVSGEITKICNFEA